MNLFYTLGIYLFRDQQENYFFFFFNYNFLFYFIIFYSICTSFLYFNYLFYFILLYYILFNLYFIFIFLLFILFYFNIHPGKNISKCYNSHDLRVAKGRCTPKVKKQKKIFFVLFYSIILTLIYSFLFSFNPYFIFIVYS